MTQHLSMPIEAADRAVANRRKRSAAQRSEMWYAYLFILPMVIGYIAFLLGPIITSFYMSLTDWSLVKESTFIGLANYRKLMFHDPVFWDTAWNTLYFTICLVPLNIMMTLGLALLMQKAIPGISFFRTAIFTPVVTSIVVWAVVWKYILATDNGVLNIVLRMFGIEGHAWLYDMKLAIPVIVVVTLLKGLGMNMVIFIAALQDVPKMYYEAARIDGSSPWQTFRNVTLPLISPSIFLVTIITMIGSLKVFGQIFVMTDGGPGTSTYVFVYYIYQQAYKIFQFGYASSIAFVLFFIILALTILQWFGRKKWVHYED
ncbi:carbohydrate ABC transporter permease [Paenibacillus roseipurpureus]|uniref:Sugar ABC transporter permease n=1 Tax=Paenibacillus roseopurpureus TaxID=2918901 RepID=A0AA96LN35_9BACL|nr:sugar ABC transporter permease [Paenibacillus sp. MBLB1832]WNR44054.1 sugar ABC transporter permease [Paenibacillus sp. MBLB1832]